MTQTDRDWRLPGVTRTVPDPGVVDTVFVGGQVWTGDSAGSWATGFAVSGGALVAVGGDDVRSLAGHGTEVVHLEGKIVVPGFIDSHLHPILAGLKMLAVDLSSSRSRLEYAQVIAHYAESVGDGWVLGGGWSFDAFTGGVPTAVELDRLVGRRPAALTNRDGHTYWVSSRALELAGIDRSTPDPPDGRIERDADGHPTGALQEGAMALVDAVLPPVTDDTLLEALLVAQRYLHTLGITGWQDARIEPAFARVYTRAADEGLLLGDVTGALWWERDHRPTADQVAEMVRTRRTMSRPGLRFASTKLMLDGVAENFTASMLEPYIHDCLTHDQGLSFFTDEALHDVVRALDGAGQQLHFHAVGDGAVRQALDAIEMLRSAHPQHRIRHHIAHIQVVHPDDIGRFRTLGAAANAQALWARREPQMTELTMPFLGERRSGWQYPFGSLDRVGAMISMGSDWPVSTPEPFRAMHVAVNRTPARDSPTWTPADGVFMPEERLPFTRALRAYTSGSAWVNGSETDRGTIEPGKRADVVVLQTDPFAGPPDEIWATRAEQTWIDGVRIHGE